jgi:hypothetical protein
VYFEKTWLYLGKFLLGKNKNIKILVNKKFIDLNIDNNELTYYNFKTILECNKRLKSIYLYAANKYLFEFLKSEYKNKNEIGENILINVLTFEWGVCAFINYDETEDYLNSCEINYNYLYNNIINKITKFKNFDNSLLKKIYNKIENNNELKLNFMINDFKFLAQ